MGSILPVPIFISTQNTQLKTIDISGDQYNDDRTDINAFLKLLSRNTNLQRLISINAQNTNIKLETLAAFRSLQARPHFIREAEESDISGQAILPLTFYIRGNPAWRDQWAPLRYLEHPSTKSSDVFYTSYQEFGRAQIKLDIIE